MARPPVIKKEELLTAAVTLFRKNGVDNTTVSDIVSEAHVAQGTFYNYFQSKDDIFADVLEKETEQSIDEMRKTAKRNDIDSVEKLELIAQQDFLMNRQNDNLFDVLHEPRYAYTHQKYIIGRIQKLKPIYAELIRQGVSAGLLMTSYPEETAYLLLITQKFMFEPAFFTFSKDEMLKMVDAFSDFAGRVLGIKHDLTMQKEWEQHILKYFGGGTK